MSGKSKASDKKAVGNKDLEKNEKDKRGTRGKQSETNVNTKINKKVREEDIW